MAIKIDFSLSQIPFTALWLTVNEKEFRPMNTGRLGAFPIGTVIKINLAVTADHVCYDLDSRDPSRHTPKRAISDGVYEKIITIVDGQGMGLSPRWPDNTVCLDVADRRFTTGIVQQNGIFYFAVEEYTSIEYDFKPGMVKHFSVLRGFGAVASGNQTFDHKIHWTACPKRDNGLRYLETWETIKWLPENIIDTNGSSTFLKEIKACTLA